ncbi:hypothetical protein N7461_002998 [Penicillium sp. DV-2018c]|nr:hypothetical protein N7461_002998 [Penicillium sp. DV-2018c]
MDNHVSKGPNFSPTSSTTAPAPHTTNLSSSDSLAMRYSKLLRLWRRAANPSWPVWNGLEDRTEINYRDLVGGLEMVDKRLATSRPF